MNASQTPVRAERTHDGRHLRLALAGGRGNVLDRHMMAALGEALAAHAADPRLKAVTLAHEGPHFSYGASIPEHLPDQVASMLAAMHALCRALAATEVFLQASVRGYCLGGGLEVALCCDRIVASPGATLGQPEVDLGVIAPVASVLLPLRVGEARAVQLLTSGRRVDAAEALALGLVDEVADDPDAAALAFAEAHLFAKSGAALRHAIRAARASRRRALGADLDAVEQLYLGDLMRTHDAVEGVQAFIEKREARFRDH